MSSDNRDVPATTPTAQGQAPAVDHYENFPVASVLCPPALRPAVAAIYWFARTADDIADEGTASAAERLADLTAYRDDLSAIYAGRPASTRWPRVFEPLARMAARHALPQQLLADLLSAFMQDVRMTDEGAVYADRTGLLDYCQRSAAPVGRLMLHLYGVHDEPSNAQSDAICNALQLINFWQDLSVDLPRRRYYLPADHCAPHGVTPQDPAALGPAAARQLVAEQVRWAREMMLSGAPLVHRVPGRAGWELRLVVQGGLRILDKIEAMDFATWHARPKLRAWDVPVTLWRAIAM